MCSFLFLVVTVLIRLLQLFYFMHSLRSFIVFLSFRSAGFVLTVMAWIMVHSNLRSLFFAFSLHFSCYVLPNRFLLNFFLQFSCFFFFFFCGCFFLFVEYFTFFFFFRQFWMCALSSLQDVVMKASFSDIHISALDHTADPDNQADAENQEERRQSRVSSHEL